MPVTLATIRDRQDQEVAHLEADTGEDDLLIKLAVSEDSWRATLDQLPPGRLTMMIDGVLCLKQVDEQGKRLVFLDEALAQAGGGVLRLVYVPEGIEAAHQLKRQIARRQEFTVPFSELMDILHKSRSR